MDHSAPHCACASGNGAGPSTARTARVVLILSASSAMRKFANEVIISVEFSSCSWAEKWSEEAMIVRVTLGLMLPANNVRCWS